MKHRFLAKRYWESNSTLMGDSEDFSNIYEDIIDLSLGDPNLTTDKRIIEKAFMDAINGHTHYTNSFGDMELRQEIINYYKEKYRYNLDLSELMVVVGGCHGMYLTLESIIDEGDEVIVPAPYFTPYIQQVNLVKGKPVILDTFEDNNFQIDIKKLQAALTNKSKAIIINNPNNPTGATYHKDTLKAIAQIAIENDLLIIEDNVYSAYSYDNEISPITAIEGMRERVVTIVSFSKEFAMTGWRIGYVIAPPFLIKNLKNINEGVTFTAPSISQRAALHALKMRKLVQPCIVEEMKKRISYSYERIKEIGKFSVLMPTSSFYLFINIKDTGLKSEEVVKKILKEAHVLVLPGTAFGECGEGYIRIACTVGLEMLKEAFDRIESLCF